MFNFKKNEIIDFINSEVPTYQRAVLLTAVNSDSDSQEFYDSIGRQLTGEYIKNSLFLNAGPLLEKTSFLDKVKAEVYKLICTSDAAYEKERNFFSDNFKTMATIVATAIATTLSLGTGLIIGIVTNVLISLIKIGKNAWCENYKSNHPIAGS